ncbi:MAG: CxxxxCH/CxxCH domain-containing protein, partial [Nitrospirae bacterium]
FNAWVSLNGTAPSWTNPTCGTTYCHSTGAGTAGIITPNWTSIPTGDCGNCHGADATTPPASTRHTQHVGNAQGYKFACSTCHSGEVSVTADSTTKPTITNFTQHVNKTMNVAFNQWVSTGAYTFVAGQNSNCSATYCHSAGTTVATGGAPTGSAMWNTTMNCAGCHGIGTTDGRPNYTSGTPKANSHLASSTHAAEPCQACHFTTTATGTSITSFSRHLNKSYDVSPWGSASFTYTYNATGGSCSAISCHGGSGGVWGSSGSFAGGCNGCHDYDTTSGGTAWGKSPQTIEGFGAHVAHIEHLKQWYSTGVLDPSGQTFGAGTPGIVCGTCHTNTLGNHKDSSRMINFGDGTRARPFGASWPTYSGASGSSSSVAPKTCSNIDCHFKITPYWNTF